MEKYEFIGPSADNWQRGGDRYLQFNVYCGGKHFRSGIHRIVPHGDDMERPDIFRWADVTVDGDSVIVPFGEDGHLRLAANHISAQWFEEAGLTRDNFDSTTFEGPWEEL